MGDQADSTEKIATLLLRVLEEHARDARACRVPRDVYVRAVADHARSMFDKVARSEN